MATTTNYAWETPDDTDLVKDGAAAIRTLGSSIDTTTKALNPSTTLGDIEYRSATANTNTRLGIGSTGNVLTVAGGVPTWSAPAGSGKQWTRITNGTSFSSGNTLTISGLTGSSVFIGFANCGFAASNVEIRATFNSNSTNYQYYGVQLPFYTTWSTPDTQENSGTAGAVASNIPLYRTDNSNGNGSFSLLVNNLNTAYAKDFTVMAGTASSPNGTSRLLQGFWNNTAAVTSITISTNTSTFDQGWYYVYTSV
jgi:hypothetical protein